MDLTTLLITLAIGAVAGWIAGTLMRGGGFGLLWNIILGIIGSFVGSWLFGVLGVSSGGGLLGALITSVVGAVVVLFVAGLFRR
ncbi:MAG: GlsB/YeaQ/YmgE family stress response membrane protein [Saprospiraceae bacterium]|nr:GlsB/YeaQ/YmgE family stress response membrane protein [Lewinella sp.]